MNYYNEWDKSAAAWLRELIKAGVVPPGDVDERSITEVQPSDLQGYTQCHFFAGILGWSLALQLASWPADRPVWTGSCPCQPFSSAGKRKGHDDERHLWPQMFRLIRECRPDTAFGEQVEGAIRHGWLDGVSADLEGEGYAIGAAVLGAHSVGAPHIRQRLYWVADSQATRPSSRSERTAFTQLRQTSPTHWLADAQRRTTERHGHELAGAACTVQSEAQQRQRVWPDSWDGSADSGLGDSNITGPSGREVLPECGNQGSTWSSSVAIRCIDGKSRRVEPSIQPLVNGLPRGVVPGCNISVAYAQATSEARAMRLKGYGNAIIPQVAAEFIGAYMDAIK